MCHPGVAEVGERGGRSSRAAGCWHNVAEGEGVLRAVLCFQKAKNVVIKGRDLVSVFTFGFIRVGFVGVLPGRGWNGIRGGAWVFLFVVGLDCVDNGLGAEYYLVCDPFADGGNFRLVFGLGLQAGRGFWLLWWRFGFFLRASSFFRILSTRFRFALFMVEAIAL